MSKTIGFIVIEDEESICREYESVSKRYENLRLLGTTNNSKTGISMVTEKHPDAVILDLELHNGYGNGIAFLQELSALNLEAKPFVLVVTNNISTITHNAARNFGADFIMTKTQQDYSVGMVLGTVISMVDIAAPSVKGTASVVKSPENYGDRLSEAIYKELDMIGIGLKLKGRDYLHDAIELTVSKRTPKICTIIGKKYSKTEASVERAMQTAINHAWKTADIDTLTECYTAYINPNKGIPTITEFIYYYADKVKKSV